MLKNLRFLLGLGRSHKIARRYFVTNGFDGVLAILGLLCGFYVSDSDSLAVIVSACIGTAVALFMSGVTSAYISETAERRQELQQLEKSMVKPLENSDHGKAARLAPVFIALVNGVAPLLFALIIIFPLWFNAWPLLWGISPLSMSIGIALALTFLLGVFIGRISGRFWLWSGLRSMIVAITTVIIIWILHGLLP